MLTKEENERLTKVGPGTPMGDLLRRYWQPIAAASEMKDRWTRRVRLLGENLVLFKDRQGRFGLIEEQCPHRRASLAYGIPEQDGIRCPYHGWKFDGTGACLEQPNEPEGSSFKEKVKTAGYPLGELGGLIWAYLGPQPAPLIPRLDGFVAEGAIRAMGRAVVPCNWLQIMENSFDPVHTEWLHGRFAEFVSGVPNPASRHTIKIGFDEAEYGVIKRRLLEGQTEEDEDWSVGHPVVFPNILALGSSDANTKTFGFQIRVPIDDTNTQYYWYNAFVPPSYVKAPAHLLEQFDVYDVPFADQAGEFLTKMIYAQDVMAWVTQGDVADRNLETLSATDRGVTLYRRILQRELEKVARGEDPKFVLRDPTKNDVIDLPLERNMNARTIGFEASLRRHNVRYSAILEDLVALYNQNPSEPVPAA